MKPGFLFVTASCMVLISVEPQAAHANGDPRVGKLISQSGAALHVDALRSMKVIHAKGSVVVTGLSGSGDDWNEMGGMREAALFSTPPLGGGNGWDGDENWNLDQTGLVIVDGSVLGRSSAINQAFDGNYDLWTPSYGGATITWEARRARTAKATTCSPLRRLTPACRSTSGSIRQLTCRSRWCKQRGRWSRPLPWPISTRYRAS